MAKQKDPATPLEVYHAPVWEKCIAYAAAFIILGLVVFLLVRNQPFTDPNQVVLVRIIISLAATIFGATAPGFLHVGLDKHGLKLRSGGALALFVLTYLVTPKVLSRVVEDTTDVPIKETVSHVSVTNGSGPQINMGQSHIGGSLTIHQGVDKSQETTPVYLQLSKVNDGAVTDGTFELTYLRDQNQLGSRDIEGVNGRVTITDLSTLESKLTVTSFSHPRLEIAVPKQGATWVFPIPLGRTVAIPVRDTFVPPEPPTTAEMLTRIADAGLGEKDIVEQVKSDDQKKAVVLTVKNAAGKDFSLFLYDCWWCYNVSGGNDPMRSKYTDIRFRDTDGGKKEFKKFGSFYSTSGYFGLFITYDNNSRTQRQFMGIQNLFVPEGQELIVERTANAAEPFVLKHAP